MDIKFCKSKKNGKPECEDLIGSLHNYFWVMDGASSPSFLKVVGDFNACWCVQKLNQGIIDAVNKFDETVSLGEILAKAIDDVSWELPALFDELSTEYYLPSSTVVLVRLCDEYLDYLVLGDSYLLVKNQEDFPHVITDDRLSRMVKPDRRKEILDLLRSGIGYSDAHLNRIKQAILVDEIKMRNQTHGYWIAANKPEAAKNAISGRIPLDSDCSILLMTDGFATAKNDLDIFDTWLDLFQGVKTVGLDECIKKIRSVEDSDPEGELYPRFSWSDDASIICIERG